MQPLPSPTLTGRDLAILHRLAEHEPLTTGELRLLFFSGIRTCQARLKLLDDNRLLCRVYPARSSRGGKSEPLWFLTPNGRRTIAAPSRRAPGLSIPDLEHRRAVARFFLALIERSLGRDGEGLYTWYGETNAATGAGGGSLRPDGYGRYLIPDGEITFYLELDRGTEPVRRVAGKFAAYQRGLANDPELEYAMCCWSATHGADSRTSPHMCPKDHPGRGEAATVTPTSCSPAANRSGRSRSCRAGPATRAEASMTASVTAPALPRLRRQLDQSVPPAPSRRPATGRPVCRTEPACHIAPPV